MENEGRKNENAKKLIDLREKSGMSRKKFCEYFEIQEIPEKEEGPEEQPEFKEEEDLTNPDKVPEYEENPQR